MSNRAYKKYLKKQEEKKILQQANKEKARNEWLEKMLAAYLSETQIPGSRACLVHEETVLPKNIFVILREDMDGVTPIELVMEESEAKEKCVKEGAAFSYKKIIQPGPTRETKYWFEHHEKRAKLVDAHPDVQYLFDLSFEICRAHHKDDMEAVKEGVDAMTAFMQRYHDITDKEVTKLVESNKK